MYREVSKLILYRDLGEDSILLNMADIFKRFDSCHYRADELITDIYREMKALLDLATTYGFDKNLWHNYLTFVLVTNENSFSMTSEKVGANNGTVNHFAKNDFQVFMNLFHYDFRPIEETLGIDCFSTILDYKAIGKTERMYNKNVSEKVRALSDEQNFYIGKFVQELRAGEVDAFLTRLQAFFADFPYELSDSTERHYQVVFYLVFKLMGQFTEVEVRSARGRADAVVKTPKYIYVFEFKLNGTAEQALQQIDEKGYLIPYQADDREVVKVGVEFSAEKRNIDRWLL